MLLISSDRSLIDSDDFRDLDIGQSLLRQLSDCFTTFGNLHLHVATEAFLNPLLSRQPEVRQYWRLRLQAAPEAVAEPSALIG